MYYQLHLNARVTLTAHVSQCLKYSDIDTLVILVETNMQGDEFRSLHHGV